jgi:hypothetical protein
MLLFLLFGGLVAVLFPVLYTASRNTKKAVDGSTLRTLGQAIIAYGNDHGVFPPEALQDAYSLAAEMARAGLNDPRIWLSRVDPAAELYGPPPATILKPGSSTEIDPRFQGAPLAWAVALYPPGTRFMELPSTTPIAWTRGLRPDGTWAPDSPYGDSGGFVVFLGGNLEKYQTIDGHLTSFSQHPTSNILDTLPPGTRVSEYVPSPEMSRRIISTRRQREFLAMLPDARAALPLALALACAVALTSPRLRAWARGPLIIGGVIAATSFWYMWMDN